ncbi:hypothetical protein ES703_103064 [subsurface metagenome]
MPIVTATIVPAEVSQEQFDAKFGTTTKKLSELGGGQTSDDLTEGETNLYDTGVPPATTDELAEGAANKYDTGVPPTDLDGVPDSATRKAMSETEQTKLTGIEDDAKADQTGAEIRDLVVALDPLERKLVVTTPAIGEHKVTSVERNAAGEFAYKYNDVPEE